MQVLVLMAPILKDTLDLHKKSVRASIGKCKMITEALNKVIDIHDQEEMKAELLQRDEIKAIDTSLVCKARNYVTELIERLEVGVTLSDDNKYRVPQLDQRDMKKLNAFWQEYAIFVQKYA